MASAGSPTVSSRNDEVLADTKPVAGLLRVWSEYKKSLKPLEVEEPVDVWIHRPLAFLLAKSLLPTGVSPNWVTLSSMCCGGLAAACLLGDQPRLQWGALFLFLSAIFDCADGQLARLRGTSSAFGRMLDGVADLVVIIAAIASGSSVIWTKYHETPWLVGCLVVLTAFTVVTGSFHTSMYDHYKNLYLRLTHEGYHEGEDYEAAQARHAEGAQQGIVARIVWPIYMFYVRSQTGYVRHFDPYTTMRLNALPAYTPEQAELYRKHMAPVMRIWRTWFGFGSLVFGLSLAFLFNVVEFYVIARCLLLNAFFYGYLRQRQQRASQRAFQALGYSVSEHPKPAFSPAT